MLVYVLMDRDLLSGLFTTPQKAMDSFTEQMKKRNIHVKWCGVNDQQWYVDAKSKVGKVHVFPMSVK